MVEQRHRRSITHIEVGIEMSVVTGSVGVSGEPSGEPGDDEFDRS
jgi:hypothetical protein